jgi:hypothetical protein
MTQAQIISASNAVYFDNVSGSITPTAIRILNTDWVNSTVTTDMVSGLTVASASYAVLANTALTATSSQTATNATNASTASLATQALNAATANLAITASYALTASLLLGGVVSSSYSVTSSLPLNGVVNATVLNSTITFTKGDGTSFNLTIAQSGSVSTASLALNSELLDGLDSTSFATTSSFNSFSSSLVSDYATKAQVTSSISVLSGSVQVSQNALSSSLSSRVTSLESFSSSLDTTFATDASVTASIAVLSGSVQVSQNALSSSLSSRTSTNETNITTLTNASASFAVASGSTSTRLVALESFSSSLDTIYATDASVTASINVLSGSVQASQLALSSSVSTRFGLAPTLAGNNTFTGNNIFGNITASNAQFNSASIEYLSVVYQTSSVVYSSGSNQFGDAANDVQTLYGTVDIKTGPLLVTGSVFVSGNINMVNGADIVTHHVKAVGSNGIEIQNQSAGVVGLFGAGGSLGTTFYGQVGAVSFVGSGSGIVGVVSSSYAQTASFYGGAVATASFAINANNAYAATSSLTSISSSYAGTASVLLGTVSTASLALNSELLDGLDSTSFTTTSSFNAFSSSVVTDYATKTQVTSSVNTLSASLAIDIASKLPTSTFTPFSSSISGRVTSLEVFSSSSAYLATASINNATITFTKGDSSNFNLTVNNVVSASYALSASYAPAAASTPTFPYTGSAIISGSLVITGSFNGLVVSQSIASNTSSLDFGRANFYTSAVTSTTFFNITNPKPGETVNVLLTTVGAATASFSSNVKQPSGSAYTPSAGNAKQDILTFISWDGSTVYLANVKNLI